MNERPAIHQHQIALHLTAPHPCSYLEGQQASTVFVAPETHIDTPLFTRLAEMGFRRSGTHIYRPQCQQCHACTPVRLPVDDFVANRNQLRCLKRNEDLNIRVLSSIDNDACYALYEKYLNARHYDGDMYPPDREQYQSFLCVPWPDTFYLAFYQDEKLLAIAVCDRFLNATSAVYTFFDPDEHKRSLGVYAVLSQIARAQLEGLDYVYLGYWIKNCQKMSYKTQYRPIELFINEQWQQANELIT